MNISRNQLLNELKTVAIGLTDKETIEQSDCFVFQNGEVLTYNDEVACRTKCSLDITGAINAKKMLDVFTKSNDETIEFKRETGKLMYRGKNKRGLFKTQDKITLPITNVETATKWKKLPKEFMEAVNLVLGCAMPNAAAVHLNCVHFTADWIEACDGVQAGRYTLSTPFKKPTLIRRDIVSQIVNLPNMRRVGFTKDWVHFKDKEGLMISCRTCPDEYPSERLTKIFESKGEKATLPEELKGLVERTKIFLDDTSESKWLKVQITAEQLRVTGSGSHGKETDWVGIKYGGKPLEFSINPDLLRVLSEKHDQCEITERFIKIEKDNFQYITSLWISSEKTKKEKD